MVLVGYSGETDFGLRQEPDKGITRLEGFLAAWQRDPSGAMAVMPHDLFTQLALAGVPMQAVGSNWELVAVQKPLSTEDAGDRLSASR